MSIKFRSIKGHFREKGGSLTQGSLALIDVPSNGICTEGGLQIRARYFKASDGTERIELYGLGNGLDFLPDEGECEREGIPIDPAE